MNDQAAVRFHRSLYLSLAMACVTLGYADWLFVPDSLIFTVPVTLSLYLAYRFEGRWALSLTAANLVGAGITVLVLGWTAFQLTRTTDSLLRHLPGLTSMLPLLGPLVLAIIPAKSFRPKHSGDYWGLQLIGLMAVALACALASDTTVAALSVGYAILAVRCVFDFASFTAGDSSQPRRGRGIALVIVCVAVALAVSLTTPRIGDTPWEYGTIANRLRTGVSDDRPSIDLNQTGQLRPSSEEAFSVTATMPGGRPKLDVSPTQRWRAATFNFYDRGKWENRRWVSGSDTARGKSIGPARPQSVTPRGRLGVPFDVPTSLPRLGPNEYYFKFPYPTKAQNFFLAEPIWPAKPSPNQPLYGPVRTETIRGDVALWQARPDGDLYPALLPYAPPHIWYVQVTAPTPIPDLSQPVAVDEYYRQHLAAMVGLNGLRQFARDLREQLPATRRLAVDAEGQLPLEHHETVARAFSDYLQNSGVFEYSFTLDKSEPNVDPAEDFLLRIRKGHCNRFSTALALMLRACGIPSRIVLGFQGAESNGDGSYVVRQSHAHSWVEALVSRPVLGGASTWHWLTLDPTPGNGDEAPREHALMKWLEGLYDGVGNFFRLFVSDVTPEKQTALREQVLALDWFALTSTGAGLAALGLVGWWLYRRWVGRRTSMASSVRPYDRLRRIVESQSQLRASSAWTPHEWLEQFRQTSPNEEVLLAAERIVEDHVAIAFAGQPGNTPQSLADLQTIRRRLARSG